jgi:hypothetical protein
MKWEDVKKVILDAAPTLGAVIGTIAPVPGGAAIGGLAGKILKQVFGTDSPDELTQVISADPNAALKLREAEIAFQLEKEKLAHEETKAYLADVQNARTREVEIAKAGKSNLTFYSIGWIITLSFFGAIVLITLKPMGLDASMRDVLNMLLGYLASNFTTVVQYFFGSSKGSADKAILLDKLVKK